MVLQGLDELVERLDGNGSPGQCLSKAMARERA
jgi:hypothetical protein